VQSRIDPQSGRGTGRWNPVTEQYEPEGQDLQPPISSQKITYAALAGLLAPELIGALGSAGGAGAAASAGGLPTATAGLPAGLGTPVAFGAGGGAAGGAAAAVGTGAKMAGGINWTKFLVNQGANIVGSLLQGRQVSKAVDAQVQGSKEAAAQLEKLYGEQKSNLAPYTSLGANAAGTLGGMLGFPAASSTSASLPPSAGPMNARGQQLTSVDPGNPDGTVTNGIPPLSDKRSLRDIFLPGAAAQQQRQSGYGPPGAVSGEGAPSGATVLMQAPDGSQRPVPAALVAQAEAKGAVRV
jgi:hypothetical protein